MKKDTVFHFDIFCYVHDYGNYRVDEHGRKVVKTLPIRVKFSGTKLEAKELVKQLKDKRENWLGHISKRFI